MVIQLPTKYDWKQKERSPKLITPTKNRHVAKKNNEKTNHNNKHYTGNQQ